MNSKSINKPLKISIITPNFNGGEHLEETILSVLNQNYSNLEYIIIDGGSTDNSLEIIKKYEDYLAYWVSESDDGLYHAIQKGFDKSTGEIMAWINSDDMYHKGSFSIVSEIFLKFKDVNWLMGKPSAYDEKGRTIKVHDLKRWSRFNFYTGDYEWIQQESVFWRRSLWEKINNNLDLSIKLAADFELWMRFFRHEKLYVINALIGGFRLRSKNQISLDFLDSYRKEVDAIIEKEYRVWLKMEDLKIVNKVKNLKNKSSKVNHIIRFYYNYRFKRLVKKYYQFPPVLYFDRLEQCFKL